jgi:hypothetical protein
MSEYKKLTDPEILSIAMGGVGDAGKFFAGTLESEIEKNLQYYMGELPEPSRSGTSKYVSQDVWDCVESMKAQLLETFSGNRLVVRFSPVGPDDVEPTRIATEVANYVWGRYNNGYMNTQAIIHNGLTARNGIVKVVWEKKERKVEETFQGAQEAQLVSLLADDSVTLDSLDADPTDGSLSGKITRTYDASNVSVIVVPPEEFIISSGATSKEDANTIGQRFLKSRSDLLTEGFDKNKVAQLGRSGSSSGTHSNVRQVRLGAPTDARDNDYQDQVEEFWIYELYKKIDIKGDGCACLHKIICTDGVLFDYEEVDSIPYFAFVPLPIPHSFYGANFVDRSAHIQNAKTTITRGILEHTVITNNPRYQVMKGGLKNPRELLDNRLGGIVNINRPDAITPLQQPAMNQFAFSVLEKMDADKEDNTGISRLSKGLNKDAISKQNSADMVGELTTLSMQRQKMTARNYAEGFLRDVFLYIYELVQKNAGPNYFAEVAGESVQVDVSTWREKKDAIVEFCIGYQEDEKEFTRYLNIHQMLSADPTMGPLYTPEKKYGTLRKALESKGIRDIDNYLVRPDQAQPPQPDPLVMQDLQNQTTLAEVRKFEAETTRMKMEYDHHVAMQELELKKLQIASNVAVNTDKIDLNAMKFEHDRTMDIQEMAMVKEQNAAGNLTAMASVNSKG